MHIEQIYFDNSLRNFSYILYFPSKKIICIDPFGGELISSKLKQDQKVDIIVNTHDHCDHFSGNQFLVSRYFSKTYAHKDSVIPNINVKVEDQYIIHQEEGWLLKVLFTPGHTLNHICLVLLHFEKDYAIFTGDCLFYAGVGNCHNGGDVNLLFNSIQNIILNLNEDILIYPGHDYLKRNLEFTLSLENNNEIAKQILTSLELGEINSLKRVHDLKKEKEINLFLRSKSRELFCKMRELRNKW